MTSEPSLVYLRAAELLADGKWHDYSVIVREVAKVVPPGKAIRKSETMRQRAARQHGSYVDPDNRKIPRTDERLIEYGALAIVRATLSGSVLFEIKPRGTHLRDGPKRIRIVPGKKPWRASG